jgi:CDP-glucose 4,6-dehydratase
MKQNILITGGFGLLGQSLSEGLDKKKFNIFVLDKIKNKKRNKFLYKKNLNIIHGDFNDKSFIFNIIKRKKIKIIFHTGAITQVLQSLKNPRETYQTNIMGTLNILDSIKEIDKKIILIYCSSDKAYGELKSRNYLEDDNLSSVYPYDLSKSCSDLICQSYSKVYDLRIAIVRCGNLFGPGDFNFKRIVPETIINGIEKKRLIIRSSGKLVRDYLYIGDAVKAYALIMNKLITNKKNKLLIYNVGSKYNLSVIKLARLILKLMNKSYLKPKILNYSKKEIKFQKLNFNKISKELKWKQMTSMELGLKLTIDWYVKNYKNIKSSLSQK